MTKILVVDDHPLFREGIATALAGSPLRADVVGVSCADEALRAVRDHPDLDLVLVDVHLVGRDGIRTLRDLAALRPDLPRVAITGYDPDGIVAAVRDAGAQGLLLKSASSAAIREAIRAVLEGGTCWPGAVRPLGTPSPEAVSARVAAVLTPRQRQALAHLCLGMSNGEIAAALRISERTVKAHLQLVYETLGVESRSRAIARARDLGLHEVASGSAPVLALRSSARDDG